MPDLVSSALPTVAVRRSGHPVFNQVVEAFGRPIAAPSANRFGRISPTSARDVLEELGGRIPLVVDGGSAVYGVESTVVAIEMGSGELRILRSGPVLREELEEFGKVLEGSKLEEGGVEAPGCLKSHYAPRIPMVLVDAYEDWTAEEERGEWGLLAWRSHRAGFGAAEVLSERGDLREAAATLFAKMRKLDASGVKGILAEKVPMEGIGVAINDRLGKASYREE